MTYAQAMAIVSSCSRWEPGKQAPRTQGCSRTKILIGNTFQRFSTTDAMLYLLLLSLLNNKEINTVESRIIKILKLFGYTAEKENESGSGQGW